MENHGHVVTEHHKHKRVTESDIHILKKTVFILQLYDCIPFKNTSGSDYIHTKASASNELIQLHVFPEDSHSVTGHILHYKKNKCLLV